MTDITMCEGTGCWKKLLCYRHMAKPCDYQAYFDNPPIDIESDKCSYFILGYTKSQIRRLDLQTACVEKDEE